jgi:hypothetical protein
MLPSEITPFTCEMMLRTFSTSARLLDILRVDCAVVFAVWAGRAEMGLQPPSAAFFAATVVLQAAAVAFVAADAPAAMLLAVLLSLQPPGPLQLLQRTLLLLLKLQLLLLLLQLLFLLLLLMLRLQEPLVIQLQWLGQSHPWVQSGVYAF